MRVMIALVVLLTVGVSGKHFGYFDRFCQGKTQPCYTVWDDPLFQPLWFVDDLVHWGSDFPYPPYVSWAEAAAMAATFTHRVCEMDMKHPYNVLEYVSAAHILLALHNQQEVPEHFNCTSPEMFGSLAGFFLYDDYLYNDQDIWFGDDDDSWCDFARYQHDYETWNGRYERYCYRYLYFEDDEHKTFKQLSDHFWAYGVGLGTIPYCPDIQSQGVLYQQDKYECDPNTPGVMWGTVVYFGVMEDTDGIWYATYFMESLSTVNRLQWTRPSLKSDWYGLSYFNYVYTTSEFNSLTKWIG